MSVVKKIIVIELNHRNVPNEIRKIDSAKTNQIQLALENLKEEIHELFVISTCNRFSVYVYCESERSILKIFQSFCDTITTVHLTILHDIEAIKHLFSTTSGLQSQTIREHEIPGQIRSAFALSDQNLKLYMDLTQEIELEVENI